MAYNATLPHIIRHSQPMVAQKYLPPKSLPFVFIRVIRWLFFLPPRRVRLAKASLRCSSW